jgi:hypothetical protein
MASKAMFTGTENIIQAFDNMDNPYFSVWINKDLLFQNNDGDADKAKSVLMDMLLAAEQNQNTDILSIKFHPGKEGKYITDKTPVVGTLFVRVVPVNGASSMSGVQQSDDRLPYPIYKATLRMQEIADQMPAAITGINERLTALENGSVGEVAPVDPLERILGLMSNPVIMALVQRLLPGLPLAPMQVSGVAGNDTAIDPNQTQNAISEADYVRLDSALGRLMKHCNLVDDLTSLADLAEQSPDMFKMLLMQLRSK